ncbi:MAG: geranylgeranylglyceryl/heptaprenylglyceryl phosphate synthase [Bacteroidales bacterium]|nr:geranylgeranylglyceryl/heptaprenylglyceryl phosphate synthase [Bacteroidales bacterium]
MNIYSHILNKSKTGQKQIAVLVDPDKHHSSDFDSLAKNLAAHPIDYFLIGGSLLSKDLLDDCLQAFKNVTDIPLIIFPGGIMQVNGKADALLFLSLISGRNPELLIGKHVESVPYILDAGIETISTGYMLIDGGNMTTAQYISNTLPIPADKPEIASLTAKAGEMLGMKVVYLDAGSGANNSVPPAMIKSVRKAIDLPLIVGGGIRSAKQAKEKLDAGADLIIIGTILEKQPELLAEIIAVVK